MTVTFDKFGRVLIPKKLRDRLGIKPGSSANLTERDGRLELAPLDDNAGWIIAEDGFPLFTGEWPADWPPDFDVVGWSRNQRTRQILGLAED